MALRQAFTQALRASRVRVTGARQFSIFQHAADKLVVDVPEEHEGLNIEFNWSLAQDDVTPHGDAYRNLKWQRLEEFAKDLKPVGKQTAIEHVDLGVTFNDFQSTYEKVTNHLSLVDATFTQDGAVGSFKDERTRVRVIADSPVVAMMAQAMLVRVPVKNPHEDRPIVVYVATTGDFAGQEPKAMMLLDQDEDERVYAKVVVTGDADVRVVADAVSAAKKKLMEHFASSSVVLPCDAVLKESKTALVFNGSDAIRGSLVNAGLLYAAHMNIWNSVGVTSLFGGALVGGATPAKKQVLALENGAAVHVPCNNIVDHPKAAFFVQQSGGVKPISAADAAALLKKSNADVDVEQFEQLLTNAKTQSFVVSSEADIEKTLAKI